MILRDALRQAAFRLSAAGIDQPMRDARLLAAHAAGIDPSRLTLVEGDTLAPDALASFEAAIRARLQRQPVAQIIGQRSFWGRSFIVTPDTLDPRPETETLIAEALRLPWHNVLDLGTGTGAILLTLLAERPGTTGMGVDLSEAALAVAARNAEALGVSADLRQSDWFEVVTGRFDLIISNPPYISRDELPALSPEVREWEPLEALTDHADGLTAYRIIAAQAPAHLMPGGAVLVEIGHHQGEDVCKLFAAAAAETAILQDLDGRDRVICAKYGENPA